MDRRIDRPALRRKDSRVQEETQSSKILIQNYSSAFFVSIKPMSADFDFQMSYVLVAFMVGRSETLIYSVFSQFSTAIMQFCVEVTGKKSNYVIRLIET